MCIRDRIRRVIILYAGWISPVEAGNRTELTLFEEYVENRSVYTLMGRRRRAEKVVRLSSKAPPTPGHYPKRHHGTVRDVWQALRFC